MKLVPDWRDAWRWWSVQALTILAALPLVWPALPADVRAWMPEDWEPFAFVTIAFGGIVGRLLDQPHREPGP
jgi:hypothetical protein